MRTYESIHFTNEKFPPHGVDVKEGAITFGYYGSGDIAIQIIDFRRGPYTVATVNLEEYGLHPRPDHVFIKDYSETDGLWRKLHQMGIISEPVNEVPFGPWDAKAQECRITAESEQE